MLSTIIIFKKQHQFTFKKLHKKYINNSKLEEQTEKHSKSEEKWKRI